MLLCTQKQKAKFGWILCISVSDMSLSSNCRLAVYSLPCGRLWQRSFYAENRPHNVRRALMFSNTKFNLKILSWFSFIAVPVISYYVNVIPYLFRNTEAPTVLVTFSVHLSLLYAWRCRNRPIVRLFSVAANITCRICCSQRFPICSRAWMMAMFFNWHSRLRHWPSIVFVSVYPC